MAKLNKPVAASTFFDRVGPVLLLGTIVLSFMVGVLWQKVAGLEGGGRGVPTQPSAGAGTGGTNPSAPSPLSNLAALAKKAGVKENDFQSCFDSKKYADVVEKNYQSGIAAGVTGTPGSFITNSKGEVWFVPGAFPFEEVKKAIDVALGKSTDSPAQITKLPEDKAKTLAKVSDSDHMLGKSSSGVYLITYTDLQCPFCQKFHPTVEQVVSEYKNEVAVVYRHFPLDQIHPYARPAAEASECVSALGGSDSFWKFVSLAFGAN